jgi:LmbE family N-acetylglucosaminyl deacetylase
MGRPFGHDDPFDYPNLDHLSFLSTVLHAGYQLDRIKSLGARMVVVIGAHPDDAELGAGGFLLAAKQAGYKTGIVVLTRGEGSASGTGEERLKEARRAAQILGVDRWQCLNLPDTALGIDRVAQEALETILVEWRPRLIVTHSRDDWHGDHRAASSLVDLAWALANRRKRHGDNLLPRPKILHFTVDLLRKEKPMVLVDIGPHIEKKREALEAFTTQKTVLEHVLAYNALWGKAAGVTYAEDFSSPEPILLNSGLSLL